MVFDCVVPGCKTKRKSCLKLSLFSIPKDIVRRQKWKAAISVSNLEPSKHRVCEKHFLPENIVRCTEHRDSTGNLIAILPLRVPKLTVDAVPSLFWHGNKCENESAVEKSDNLIRQNTFGNVSSDITNQISSLDNVYTENSPTGIAEDLNSKNYPKGIEIKKIHQDNFFTEESANSDISEQHSNVPVLNKSDCDNKSNASDSSKNENIQNIDQKQIMFTQLCENINTIHLQKDWIVHVPSDKNCIVFTELNVNTCDNESYYSDCTIKRSLVIKNTMKLSYRALGKHLASEQLNLVNKFHNFEELQVILNEFSSMPFCSGIADIDGVDLVKNKIGYMDCFDKLRHNNCHVLTLDGKCKICKNVRKTVSQRRRRMSKRNTGKKKTSCSNFTDKNVLHIWKKRIRAQRSVIKRAKNTIEGLRNRVDEMKADLSNTDIQSVLQKCSDHEIPNIQRTLIGQIVASAKVKSVKGQRYSEDWMMLCILMHIRSPKEYKHLRNLGLLPLPCERTVRRYLSLKYKVRF